MHTTILSTIRSAQSSPLQLLHRTAFNHRKNQEEIQFILKTASSLDTKIIPFSAGSSLEGHCLPVSEASCILDTSSLDFINLNKQDLDCVVGPGVNWVELNDYLLPHGLFFPNDPGMAACFGGMCGTGCSGTLAYGTMKHNVLGLKVVLADGTVITTRRRPVKSSAGYDLTSLFIGSEGTLGVISSVSLRLHPIPKFKKLVLSQFKDLESCADAVRLLVASGLSYHRLEIMDDLCMQGAVSYDPAVSALGLQPLNTLMAECADQCDAAVSHQIKVFSEISHSFGGTLYTSQNEQEYELLWRTRKNAFFSSKHLVPYETDALTTDVAVPRSRLHEILTFTKRLLREHNLVGPIVAHAGDGNFHSIILIPKNDSKILAKAEHVRDAMAKLAIHMDGTCTGEHGVGIGKRNLLVQELGIDSIQVMRTIKAALDPKGILNPGKVFEIAKIH